jgi:translocator protein
MKAKLANLTWGTVAGLAAAATSLAGGTATYPNLEPWYASLAKPSFNPPNWVFAPVWTSLYVLIAISLWRILKGPPSGLRNQALSAFAIMLVVNAAWSWMFFAAHSPFLGLVNIVPQLALIAATIVWCHRLDRLAAWCLVPLLAWVSFASVLNLAIWRLNG